MLVLGAGVGAGAVSWLYTWWRQVAGAGSGCRCWCCEPAVHVVRQVAGAGWRVPASGIASSLHPSRSVSEKRNFRFDQ